jgi:hypothetical protein
MSSLDMLELKNRLQLLRKMRTLGTDEALELSVKRFNDLSDFLGKVLRKEKDCILEQ